MPMYTNQPGNAGILPHDYGQLVVQPFMKMSIAAQVSTVLQTSLVEYHLPVVLADPSANWVAEGDEIAPSIGLLAELIVRPRKIAGLTVVSNELADDSSPAAAEVVGQGLARDMARRADEAFFGSANGSGVQPQGVGALGNTSEYVDAAAFSNLDFAAEAVARAEAVGATVTHFVSGPETALQLAKVKAGAGSNAPLLGQDATAATARQVLGVPLVVSAAVPDDTLYAFDRSRVFTVVRRGATVEADRSVLFTSDRTAIRGVMRLAFGFAHAQSIVRVATA